MPQRPQVPGRIRGTPPSEAKLAAHNSAPMDEVNKALGVGMGGPRHANVEIKYTGPNGEMIDVSAHGWVGTRGFD